MARFDGLRRRFLFELVSAFTFGYHSNIDFLHRAMRVSWMYIQHLAQKKDSYGERKGRIGDEQTSTTQKTTVWSRNLVVHAFVLICHVSD